MRFNAVSLAVALALSTLAAMSTPGAAAEGERADREIMLAELGYTNGVSASFTIDEQSRDYGFQQAGEVGRNGPLIDDAEERSYLQVYLTITPRSVAVPQLIVSSHPTGVPLPAEMAFRKVTANTVRVTGLTAPASVSSPVPCNYANIRHRIYYWSDWYLDYIKHWDSVVTPFHWQAKEKGSVIRTRMVRYDAGWDYTRAGRFHN